MIGTRDLSLIYLAYNQGYSEVRSLMRVAKSRNADVIWKRAKMRGKNPKKKILNKIRDYKEVFNV